MNLLRIRQVVVVLPFRNEEAHLLTACESLGFASGEHTEGEVTLILVNNGSTDGSTAVAQTVRAWAPGRVVVVAEPEVGYVPARKAGISVAASLFAGLPEGGVLIVQADADTTYGVGYVSHLLDVADRLGPGTLVNGRSTKPRNWDDSFPLVSGLFERADAPLDYLWEAEGVDDVIVDDKTAAFRISDYADWGGHQHECWRDGTEMYAETTRLYIRARAAAATRGYSPAAVAVHSTRRLEERPLAEFVAGGFPGRGQLPAELRGLGSLDVRALESVLSDVPQTLLDSAIELRRRNVIAEFGILPRVVAAALEPASGASQSAERGIWRHSALDVRVAAGRLVEEAFVIACAPDFDVNAWLR